VTEGNNASVVRQALAAIDELQSRIASLQSEKFEPIAVVGMACRFPGGVNTPEDYWKLLIEGKSALSPIPSSRWRPEDLCSPDNDGSGHACVRAGYFLDKIEYFDAAFFGISPREAELMDPQQRLLMEVAWEALERSGQTWQTFRESKTGVFVGIANNDYAQMLVRSTNLKDSDSLSGTGNSDSFHTGRLSYHFGFQGPCVAIDTACSSSLVAIHLACASLRTKESDRALAGGVQALISPYTQAFLSNSHALSADGMCKAFDSAADGYGRGEGCGIVVLKRLSDAQRDGDLIWGIIRATAVNHDGPSSGLTVPNPKAQIRVLEAALKESGIDPTSVDYIEAHGVGTPLGDPIEMRTISAVLGAGRALKRPIYVGSAKTNIGHLEAAAGIAGFIKTLLALYHGQIPRNLHFNSPTPQIDWQRMPVAIPTRNTAWPHQRLPRRGAINAFGLSGTNAHVILESPPVVEQSARVEEGCFNLLAVSARTEEALNELLKRYHRQLLSSSPARLADFCYTAGIARPHFNCRAAIVASDPKGVSTKIEALSNRTASPGAYSGQVPVGEKPPVVFLFTGQGSQYAGMGRELYQRFPVFRATIDSCDAFLRDQSLIDVSIAMVIQSDASDDSLLSSTLLAQTCLFSFEMALFDLWQSWGIAPDAVLGHSLGEYSAACAAGVFGVEDGLRLLVARGRLVESLTSEGEMATVFATEDELKPYLAQFADSIGIAAINGPNILVVSGLRKSMQALLAQLEVAGMRALRLPIAQAFHSPLIEPILESFERAASNVRFAKPHTTLLSNLTGCPATEEITTSRYWRDHLRQTVRFYDCLRVLHSRELEIFVELGPEPILLAFDQCLPEGIGASATANVLWLPSVRRDLNSCQQILESLGSLYVRGHDVDWMGLYRGAARERVLLPTYPFESKRYWGIAEQNQSGLAKRSIHEESAEGVALLLERGDLDSLMGIVESQMTLAAGERNTICNALRTVAEFHRAKTAVRRLDGVTYKITWRNGLLSSPDVGGSPHGNWVLFSDPTAAASNLAEQLETRGAKCHFVTDGREYQRSGDRSWSVRSDQPDDWRRLFDDMAPTTLDEPLRGMVFIWPERASAVHQDLETQEAMALRMCGALLHALQAIAKTAGTNGLKIWAVTRGAVAAGSEDAYSLEPFGAALWGAAKVSALEYPQLWGGIIDIQGVATPGEAASRLLDEMTSGSAEDQIVIRGTARLVPRLVATRIEEHAMSLLADWATLRCPSRRGQ